jgi:hypothetical protein
MGRPRLSEIEVVLKQVYNQQIAHIKTRENSCTFRLVSLAAFREYQYQKSHAAFL